MSRSLAVAAALCGGVTALSLVQRGAGRQVGAPLTSPIPALTPSRVIHAHGRRVYSLAYSRDGTLLASAGGDGTVKLWQPHTGRCLRAIRTATECVAFSPDGRWLATGNGGAPDPLSPSRRTGPTAWLARVWSARTGRLAHTLSGHHGVVDSVDYSPDGRRLATAGEDGSVRVWDTASWRTIATRRESFPSIEKGDTLAARQARFSPDGRLLAVVTVAEYEGAPTATTYRLVLWDTTTWQRRRTLAGVPPCDTAVAAFSPDSRRLLVATDPASLTGSVFAWDLTTGRKTILAGNGIDGSLVAALIPPGRWLAAGGMGTTAVLIDSRIGWRAATLPHETMVRAMAAAPDGKSLATGDGEGAIRLWQLPARLAAHPPPVDSASRQPAVPVVRQAAAATALTPRRLLRAHHGPVHALAYSRDGQLIASAGGDGTAKLWDPKTCRCLRILLAPTECVAFSPDGKWLATGSYDPDVAPDTYRHPTAWLAQVWRVASGQRVRALAGHNGPVESLDWSPDGRQLATANGDGTVKVWRTDTWQPAATLRETFTDVGKGDGVMARQALYSPDGKMLAVVSVVSYHGEPGSDATRIVLWNTATWKRQRVLLDENNDSPCWSAVVAFTPDSRRLTAATKGRVSDGDVYVWDLPAGSKRSLAGPWDASYAAALIPPGRWLAAGGTEWTAYLIDLETEATVATLPHSSEVLAMAASPDGRTLATGDSNGFVRLWPLPAGK